MHQNKLLLAALGAMFALPALAEDGAVTQHKEDIHVIPASAHTVTSNVSLVTDYLYRGISQTGQKPAIQGGFDYARSNGFYAGAWGSNISWLSDAGVAATASLELDTYFGFKNSFATDFIYDVGFLRYNYPGTYVAGATKGDTDEIYGLIGYKWITAKYSYALGDTFGVPDARGSSYFDLSASYAIPDTGVTLGAHYGKQTYQGSSAKYNAAIVAGTPTYTDYKLGATKDFSGYLLGLAYSKTNAASGGFYTSLQGKDLGRGTVILSLGRSL